MERLTPPVKITESEEQRILNKLRCSKEVCELFVGKSLSLGLVSRSMNNGIHLALTTASTTTTGTNTGKGKVTNFNTKESSDDLKFGLRVNNANVNNKTGETDEKVSNTTTPPPTILKAPSLGPGSGPVQTKDESDSLDAPNLNPSSKSKYNRNHIKTNKILKIEEQRYQKYFKNHLKNQNPKAKFLPITTIIENGLEIMEKIKTDALSSKSGLKLSDNNYNAETNQNKTKAKAKYDKTKIKETEPQPPKANPGPGAGPGETATSVEKNITKSKSRELKSKPRSQSIQKVSNQESKQPASVPVQIPVPTSAKKNERPRRPADRKDPPEQFPGMKPGLVFKPWGKGKASTKETDEEKVTDPAHRNPVPLPVMVIASSANKKHKQIISKNEDGNNSAPTNNTRATPHGILQMIKSAFDYASPSSHNHNNDSKDKHKQSSRNTDNSDNKDGKQSSLEKSPMSSSPLPTKSPIFFDSEAQNRKTGGPDNFELNHEGQKQNAEAVQPPTPSVLATRMDLEIKSSVADVSHAESQKLLFRKHVTGTSIVASMAEESTPVTHSKQALLMDPRIDDLDELVRGPLFSVDGGAPGGRASTAPSTSCISTMTHRTRRKLHHDAAFLHGKAPAAGTTGVGGLPNTATITSKTKGPTSLLLPGNKYMGHQLGRSAGVRVRTGSGTYENATNKPFDYFVSSPQGQGADSDQQNGGIRSSKMPPPSFHATFSRRNHLSKKLSATVTATGGLIVDGGRGKMRRTSNKFGTKYGLGLGLAGLDNENENEGETPAELVARQHQKIIAAGLSHSYSHSRSRRSHSKHKSVRRTAETEDHQDLTDPSTDLKTSASVNAASVAAGIGTNAESLPSTPTPAKANETLKKLPSRAKSRCDRDRDREACSGNKGVCSSISCSPRSRTRSPSPSPNPSPSPTPTRPIKESPYHRTKHSIKSKNAIKNEEDHASGKIRSPTAKSRRSSRKNIDRWDADDREFGHIGTSTILNPNKRMLVGMRELVKAYEIQNLKNQKVNLNNPPSPAPPPVHPRSRKVIKDDERAEESSAVNLAVNKKPTSGVIDTVLSTEAD